MEEHIVKIISTGSLTHDVKIFRVEKPAGYTFTPGQATDVSVNTPELRNKKRPFTFTGLDHDPYLEFIIKIYPSHKGVTNEIDKLFSGDELIIRKAWGAISYKGPGIFYTAPPLSLSYRGYGEIATTIAVGIVVPIMGYICANGILSIEIAGLLIPSVIYGLVFILTVEIPDMEDDAQGNKRTFVAVYGRHAAVRIIAACCIVASIVFSLFTVLPIVPALIDYRLVAGLTAIPLAAAVSGVMRMPTSKHSSVPFVMRSMTSLVAFTALFDAYLVITVL